MDRIKEIIDTINNYQKEDNYKSYIISPLLKELIELNDEKRDYEVYLFIGENYSNIGRFSLASKYYEEALNLIMSNNMKSLDLGLLFNNILVYRNYYIDDDCVDLIKRVKESKCLSEGKINSIVERVYNHRRSLKHDPIEASEEYLSVIDEVEEKIDKNRTHFGMGSCHEYWNLKFQYLMEKGIFWKSPSSLNPRVMFD